MGSQRFYPVQGGDLATGLHPDDDRALLEAVPTPTVEGTIHLDLSPSQYGRWLAMIGAPLAYMLGTIGPWEALSAYGVDNVTAWTWPA